MSGKNILESFRRMRRKNQIFVIIFLILLASGAITSIAASLNDDDYNTGQADMNTSSLLAMGGDEECIYTAQHSCYSAYGLYYSNSNEPAPGSEITSEVLVTFLDVGQGSSILIQTENSVMLIDASWGRYAYRIINYLHGHGIEFIDVVVATHPHADHIGGFPAIFDVFDIGRLYKPRAQHTTNTFFSFMESLIIHNIDINIGFAGHYFMLYDVLFTMVAPNNEGYGNLNNYSIVIHMQHGDISFLFTGDAEALSENQMISNRRHIEADVLKVGHHGSRTSTTPLFLNTVNPTYAVIQVSYGNQYGHPHDEVLDRLYQMGVTVYRTDLHGKVQMLSDGMDIWITVGAVVDIQ